MNKTATLTVAQNPTVALAVSSGSQLIYTGPRSRASAQISEPSMWFQEVDDPSLILSGFTIPPKQATYKFVDRAWNQEPVMITLKLRAYLHDTRDSCIRERLVHELSVVYKDSRVLRDCTEEAAWVSIMGYNADAHEPLVHATSPGYYGVKTAQFPPSVSCTSTVERKKGSRLVETQSMFNIKHFDDLA